MSRPQGTRHPFYVKRNLSADAGMPPSIQAYTATYAQQGGLDDAPPNPSEAGIIDVWHPRPSRFDAAVAIGMSQSIAEPQTPKSLPYDYPVGRHAGEPVSRSKFFFADNRFLLGLRSLIYRVSSGSHGSSGPPISNPAEMKLLPRRPNVFPGFVVGWPKAPITYPTFGGSS